MRDGSIIVDGVFDLETEAWDRYVLGGMLAADGTYRSTRDEEELVDWLLSVGGQWWTWNGGLFDTLWLGEKLRARGLRYTCALAGPRVTRLECSGLVVRDAFALIPMALAKAAKIAGIDLAKDTGLACRCDVKCGGYCSISRAMPEGDFRSLDRYLRADCVASLAALDAVRVEAERCEYLLTGTVGGSSYKTVAKLSGIDPAQWPDARTFKLADAARYGGRVEVFRPSAPQGFAYDINSAYPAALATLPLPTGAMRKLDGARAKRAFARGVEGLYMARVRVPAHLHLPPLPVHTPAGRTIFPTGLFRGTWPRIELQSAVDRGCTASFAGALVWSDAEPVLAVAMLHLWRCRARAKDEGNEALAAWHKWFCNAPTGKLGERPDKERIVVNPTDDEIRTCSCPPRDKKSRRRKCYCGAWKPLCIEGRVWTSPFWRISGCAHVHWNAYLTASTRLELMLQLEQAGMGSVYCDTDGIKVEGKLDRRIGGELGEWKEEGAFDRFLALAPKLYRYWSVDDARWEVRGKGLPGLDYAGFERFRAGLPVKVSRGVMGFRSAARAHGSLFTRKHLSRANRSDGIHYGGRILTPTGITRPLSYSEAVRWEEQN